MIFEKSEIETIVNLIGYFTTSINEGLNDKGLGLEEVTQLYHKIVERSSLPEGGK